MHLPQLKVWSGGDIPRLEIRLNMDFIPPLIICLVTFQKKLEVTPKYAKNIEYK
jgi:hypothetical protein